MGPCKYWPGGGMTVMCRSLEGRDEEEDREREERSGLGGTKVPSGEEGTGWATGNWGAGPGG